MIATLRKFVALVMPADGRPRPLGKVVLRPETPEELEDLEDFCRHIGRDMEGDRLEIAFFPKRPRNGEAGPPTAALGLHRADGER